MSEAPEARAAGGRAANPLWAFAHLAVLSTFALAQPLFDLLKDNPEFFAARGSPGGDVITFAIAIVLLPPLVGLALELLAGLASARLREAVHLLLVALCVTLIAAQALKKAIDASDTTLIALSVIVALAATAAYARTEGVKSFVSVLSPAPVLFLVIFLFFSPVSKLAFPSSASARTIGGVSRTPVVVVLFDELPVVSLMDEHRHVDSARFPAFGELAANSTWFRNAYAVYDSTERAQPAIMDGNYPDKDKLPTSADHPNSIFTLLGKTYRVNGSEEATSVCPRDLCKDERLDVSYPERMRSMAEDLGLVWLHVVSPPGIEHDLASVSENWGNFGGHDDTAGGGGAPGDRPNVRSNLNRNRNKRFEEWISRITPGSRPELSLKHTLLPHVPWQYLPDAKQYRRTANDPVPGLSSEAYKDPLQIESLYQRHLLQLGFADHLLGELIRHLKREGLYDKSLIVVTADHGVAFDVGRRDRRKIIRPNAEEIAPIPLFFKAPGQKHGRISSAYAETVDILPTIFDVLNVNPKVHMDGSSAFSAKVRARKRIRILERNTFKPLIFSVADWEARKEAALERKLRFFGTGGEGPDRLFRIGPRQDLLFTPAPRVPAGSSATFSYADEYGKVDLRSPTIPVHVVGRLKGFPTGRDLAIAVNGRIAATTRSFRLAIGGDVLFAAMVPERFFRQGRNRVEVFDASVGTLRSLGASG